MHETNVLHSGGLRLASFLLILITVCVYLPAIYGGFIWDDDLYVINNQFLRNLDGLKKIWLPGFTPQYYPLTYTTFWLEFHIWGLWPTGYHLVNVLLHASNAILLGIALRTLAIPGAWFGAALFALHPVHAESVAWITERKNVLSGFFYLSSLLCYLRFSSLQLISSEQDKLPWRYYFLALLLFLGSLLSKTVTCSLPAVLLLLVWWKKERVSSKDALFVTPLFAIGILLATVTASLETNVVGAAGEMWELSLLERLLIAGRALWFYAGTLCWPSRLTFIYPKWDIDATIWWQYFFPISIVVFVTTLAISQKRLGKAPLAAALFFAGTLTPALGFFNVFPMRYSYAADHFQYLASIGILALFGGWLWKTQSFLPNPQEGKEATLLSQLTEAFQQTPYRSLLSLCILLSLGVLTWQQGHIYKDLKTLWFDTAQKNPSGWMPYNNLGVISAEEGDYQKALAYFEKAASLNPHIAEVHGNLCLAYGKMGQTDLAIQHGLQAIGIQPEWFKPYSYLGSVFWAKGERRKAASYFREALVREPKDAQTYYNLGLLYTREAEDFPDIRPREAISYLEKALLLQSGSPQFLSVLAQTLATHPDPTIRNGERAVLLAEEACRQTHYRVPIFLDTLAAAYAEAGQFQSAIKAAQRAIELAASQHRDTFVSQLQERLRLYQSGMPYHTSLIRRTTERKTD